MAKENSLDRVWDIIEGVGVCMLTTRSAAGLRARPLEARPDREAGVIWFVTDRRSNKGHEIERSRDIGLVFIDPKDKAYLSITGQAKVSDDHARAAEIWKRTDNVWWHGPTDARDAPHGGITGRSGEQSGGHVRIWQSAADRRKAQSRRESQDRRADATATRQAPSRVRARRHAA